MNMLKKGGNWSRPCNLTEQQKPVDQMIRSLSHTTSTVFIFKRAA